MWLPVVTILFYVYKYIVKYLHEQYFKSYAWASKGLPPEADTKWRERVLENPGTFQRVWVRSTLQKRENLFFFSAFIHTDVSVKFPYIYLKAIIFIVKFMDMFVKCNMFIAHYSTSNQFSICYNFLQLLFPIGYFEDQLVQSAFIY